MVDGFDISLLNRSILVVEDDAVVGIGLMQYLEELGATVEWVTSVQAGLSYLNTHEPPDAALVDLNLDGILSTPVIDWLLDKQVYTVLCSGYDVTHIDPRFTGLPRLEKPFTRAKIRGSLIIIEMTSDQKL